jgi:topoisomerase-4 subunit A
VIYKDGNYEITDTELTQRFDADNIKLIERFDPEKIVTIVYHDIDKNQYTVKRFKIETTTLKTKYICIKEGNGNYIEAATTIDEPLLGVQEGRGADQRKGKLKLAKIVEVMGWKAIGAKLLNFSKSVIMHWEETPKDNTNQIELFD